MDGLLGLGLTRNESKVYTALLKLGSALAGEITNATGIHRRNVYDSIERLMEKGLVSYVIKNQRKYFQAADPSHLFDVLDGQREEIDKKEDELRSILPSLTALTSMSKTAQRISVFEGIKGILTILDDVIKTGETNLVFSTSNLPKSFLPHLETFHKKRIKAKIKDRIISNKEDKERAKELSKLPYTEVRLTSKEFDSPLAINIYGNKIGMLIFSEKPIGIMIEDRNVAESFRKYFTLLWELAEGV